MAARLIVRALEHLRADLAEVTGDWRRRGREELRRRRAARPPPRRAAAIALALALAATGLGALRAERTGRARLPSPLDWRAAGVLLPRESRPGDAVLVDPGWLERAREIAPASVPVLPATAEDVAALPGVRRIWLVEAPEAPGASEVAGRPLGADGPPADRRRLGALAVSRRELPAPLLPLASLADGTGAAAWRLAGGAPRRCLVLAPHPGTSVRVGAPALAAGRRLSGHAGALAGSGAGAVRIAVELDGAEVGAIVVGPRDRWKPFSIETPAPVGATRPIAVVATAVGADPPPVCLEALVLP